MRDVKDAIIYKERDFCCEIEVYLDIIAEMHRIPFDYIRESLHGATIKPSALLPLFKGYSSGTNEDVVRLTELHAVPDRDERSLYPDDPVKACEMKKHDFGLVTAMFWPNAEFSRLVVCSYLILWLFLWDDEIDSVTGTRHSDLEAARRAHADVVSYMSHCLQLDYGYPKVEPTDPLILLIKDIGDALCREYDIGQREVVFEYMCLYIQGTEKEQRVDLENTMPSTQEYLAIRRESSAVLLTLAMNDYSASRRLPTKLRSHPAVRELYEQSNTAIAIGNDILSVEKEFKDGALLNYIPVAYSKIQDVQQATDEAVITVGMALRKFELAKEELIHAAQKMGLPETEVHWFIEGCEYQMTGNVNWSLESGRYRGDVHSKWKLDELPLKLE
ncbi:isoprenoid synthase domain-containing protein [Aspergillus floccosus]